MRPVSSRNVFGVRILTLYTSGASLVPAEAVARVWEHCATFYLDRSAVPARLGSVRENRGQHRRSAAAGIAGVRARSRCARAAIPRGHRAACPAAQGDRAGWPRYDARHRAAGPPLYPYLQKNAGHPRARLAALPKRPCRNAPSACPSRRPGAGKRACHRPTPAYRGRELIRIGQA